MLASHEIQPKVYVSVSPSIGPTPDGEVKIEVGATQFDILLESSGAEPEDQRLGYTVLCDLLATRMKQGAEQVMGCLLIDGDPDPDAFADGLIGMERPDGVFTPVLPLSRDQATQLVAKKSTLYDAVDPATAIIAVAASRKPITKAVAETALAELDELISRSTENSGA